MLYPESKQRTKLGWPIRWVAGLFALLTVAAGAIPAYAENTSDSPLSARNGALYSAESEERATSGELCPITGELLGSKSVSESEGEVEEDGIDSSSAPAPAGIGFLRLSWLALQRGNRSVGSTESVDQTGPRAPPLA